MDEATKKTGIALSASGLPVRFSVRMADLTTFRLGGPCKAFIDCPTAELLIRAVRFLAEHKIPYVLIGGGSNLLVSDDGVDDVVIRYLNPVPEISEMDDILEVSGATLLDDVAALAAARGLSGFTACSGIPGTVGGALAGNAGAFGEQIGDHLVRAWLLDAQGHSSERSAADLQFAYRSSLLQKTGEVLVKASFRLVSGDPEKELLRREEILALRAAKHPDWKKVPTAGSFFKNLEPTSKAERRQAAGYFLEQAGALSMCAGGARVFEKHANILTAEEGCTARDVDQLANRMAEAVRAKFGLQLEREVRSIGLWPKA